MVTQLSRGPLRPPDFLSFDVSFPCARVASPGSLSHIPAPPPVSFHATARTLPVISVSRNIYVGGRISQALPEAPGLTSVLVHPAATLCLGPCRLLWAWEPQASALSSSDSLFL